MHRRPLNRLRRDMLELCRDVARLDSPKMTGIARRASLLLPQLEPKISKAVEANRTRRKDKFDRQRTEMSELRREVFARAHGKGELCREPFTPYDPAELCHLEGGNGQRRECQSIQNCVAEHNNCHKDLDRVPLEWLDRVQTWSARYGYPIPERIRRMAALRGVEILAVEKISKTMKTDEPETPKEER
jgi:hypothetical protein